MKHPKHTSSRRLLMALAIALAPLGLAQAQSMQESAQDMPPAMTPETPGYDSSAPAIEPSTGMQGTPGENRAWESQDRTTDTYRGAQGPMRSDAAGRRDYYQRERSAAQNRGYEGFLQWQEQRSNSP